jgi:hypothetical protein
MRLQTFSALFISNLALTSAIPQPSAASQASLSIPTQTVQPTYAPNDAPLPLPHEAVPQSPNQNSESEPHTTPAPLLAHLSELWHEIELKAREVVPGAPVPPPPAQYPSITTQWVETVLANGVHTWVQVVYTQTFASVVSQGAQPGVGSIGMGTLTGQIGVLRTEQAKKANAAGRTKGTGTLGIGGVLGGSVVGLLGLVAGTVVFLGRI